MTLETTHPLTETRMFLEVKASGITGLNSPPSYAVGLEVWHLHPPGTFRAFPGLYRDCFIFFIYCGTTRGSADKSLAPPGRKQATANKHGIHSTYSPRSSIHFLAHCCNFCKPLKKEIQKVVRPTMSPRKQWPPRRKKNGDLSIVLSVHGTGGSPTGPDPENRVGD